MDDFFWCQRARAGGGRGRGRRGREPGRDIGRSGLFFSSLFFSSPHHLFRHLFGAYGRSVCVALAAVARRRYTYSYVCTSVCTDLLNLRSTINTVYYQHYYQH